MRELFCILFGIGPLEVIFFHKFDDIFKFEKKSLPRLSSLFIPAPVITSNAGNSLNIFICHKQGKRIRHKLYNLGSRLRYLHDIHNNNIH